MIASFSDEETADLFRGLYAIDDARLQFARRRLDLLNAAHSLEDLRAIRDARLEALEGKRYGWQRMRVGVGCRLLFRWNGGVAHDVGLEPRSRRQSARRP